MKIKNNRSKRLLLVTLSVLIILLTLGLWWYQASSTDDTSRDNPSDNQNTTNSTYSDKKTPDKKINEPTAETNQKENTPAPSQPSLNKSSGNNSSIPSGITVSFTCAGDIGTQCEIVLENRHNKSLSTTLTKKPLEDDGRGRVNAVFYWESKAGTWDVAAKTTNKHGLSSTSPYQELIVDD